MGSVGSTRLYRINHIPLLSQCILTCFSEDCDRSSKGRRLPAIGVETLSFQRGIDDPESPTNPGMYREAGNVETKQAYDGFTNSKTQQHAHGWSER
jgi:hypothetical protein